MKRHQSVALFLCFLCFIFSATAHGAAQQEMTIATTNTITQPIMNDRYDMWLYTKLDDTGYTQLYLQYFNTDTVTSSSQAVEEIPLTSSAFNKSSPIWGPFIQTREELNTNSWDFEYTCDSNLTNCIDVTSALSLLHNDNDPEHTTFTCPADSSQLFYYLGNSSGTRNNLYVGCLTDLKTDGTASEPTKVFADARLTGFSSIGVSAPRGTGTTSAAPAPLGIFVPSHSFYISEIASAGSNVFFYGEIPLEMGPEGSNTRTNSDNDINLFSLIIPTASAATTTSNFIPYAYAIAFTDTDGKLHYLLHNVQHLYDNSTDNEYLVLYDPSSDYVADPDDNTVTYQWDPDSQTRLYKNPRFDPEGELIAFGSASDSLSLYQLGIVNFRGTSEKIITNLSRGISHPQFTLTFSGNGTKSFGQSLFFEIDESGAEKAQMAFVGLDVYTAGFNSVSSWCENYYSIVGSDASRQHMNFKTYDDSEVIYSEAHRLLLTYERKDSTTQNIYALILEPPYNQVHGCTLVTAGTQITSPTTFTTATDSEWALTCSNTNAFPMLFQKGDDDVLIYHDEDYNLFAKSDYRDIAFLKTNADGSGISITNVYDTMNGSVCSVKVQECTTTYLTENPNADWENDGLENINDNCPCSWNPTQNDPDSDGVGETYQANNENGCDNCPGISNPANLDNNADGSYNPLDSDFRQSDLDNDGHGDTCDQEVNECGDTDTDQDGVYDLCDNCVDVANTDQLNSDADTLGDLCDNCLVIANDNQSDTDADGIGDVCEAQPDIVDSFNFITSGGACGCNINAVPTTNGVWFLMSLISLIGGLRFFKKQ